MRLFKRKPVAPVPGAEAHAFIAASRGFGFLSSVLSDGIVVRAFLDGEEIGRPVTVSPEQITRLQNTVSTAGNSDELKGLGQAWRQAFAAHSDDSSAVETYLARAESA